MRNLKCYFFRKPGDPSAHRYMVSFNCEKPFEKDGVELISLYVRGNLFSYSYLLLPNIVIFIYINIYIIVFRTKFYASPDS